MKKILCYISIFVLVLLIIIPPVFRIVFKNQILDDSGSNVPSKSSINAVSCASDSQSIYFVYVNDAITSFKYQVKISYLEINPTIIVRDTLINENIASVSTNTEEEYFVKFADTEALNEYRKDLNTNKTYFESLGYICNISKY